VEESGYAAWPQLAPMEFLMSDLTGKQKRQLRALAHSLKPVVQMGQKGATDALKSKVNQELEVHELIKVKVSGDCLETAKEAGALLAEACRAALVQVIGRTVVLYRGHPEEPQIQLS